jgi:uncharacterized protein (TIGR03435 family)
MVQLMTNHRLNTPAGLFLLATLCTPSISIIAQVIPLSHASTKNAGASTQGGASFPTDSELGQSFEVATIRPTNPDGQSWSGWKITPSGRFVAGSESLYNLVVLAYGGKPISGTITGGPKWLGSDRFDIDAKMDDSQVVGWDKLSDMERLERMRPMLQTLLAERFRLKLHTQTQLTPVYALVQANGGAKFKEVPPAAQEDAELRQARANGQAVATAPPGGFIRSGNTFTGNATPMSSLKGLIASISGLDRIVIDETGLKGYYNFTFTMSLDKEGPTILEQIQSQLGLKLEPRKASMETYVIESAEKPSLDGT